MSVPTQSAPTRELPRLLARYREDIAPALKTEFGYDNVMQIPGLVKIVVNMGVGEATRDAHRGRRRRRRAARGKDRRTPEPPIGCSYARLWAAGGPAPRRGGGAAV